MGDTAIETGSTEQPPKRKKWIYIGAPACFALEEIARHVSDAFSDDDGAYGIYVVGSCLERADWRDVDVRLIMSDEGFERLFPRARQHWEHDARWLLLTCAISDLMSKRTGLPIDFQIQPQAHANEKHQGPRNAIGIRISRGD